MTIKDIEKILEGHLINDPLLVNGEYVSRKEYVIKNIIKNMKPLDPSIVKLVDENFWELIK